MDFGAATYSLGFLAGALSTLSPCVLPLLPIVLASAVAQHRFGPLALAAGLTLSFAIVGTTIATFGASLGIEPSSLRKIAAVFMLIFGAVLLVPALQRRFVSIASGLSASGGGLLGRVAGVGLAGQFAVGILLGVVWSPCVGPTLGAATTLASQGQHVGQIALLMLIFGLGASAPLLLIGTLSREAAGRMRGTLAKLGERGKWVLGGAFVVLGLLILAGGDKSVETWVLDHSPDWLTELTTRY